MDEQNLTGAAQNSAADRGQYGLARSRSGLRGRLLALVVLTILPAFGIVLYVAHSERQTALQEIEKRAALLAELVAGRQERVIDRAEGLLSLLAELPLARAKDPCSGALTKYVQQHPVLLNVGIADATGKSLCSVVSADLVGVGVADRSYFQRAVARRGFAMGDYMIGRFTGKPSIVAAIPVLDGERVERVIFAPIRLASFTQSDLTAYLPKGAALSVLDSQYNLLARYPADDRLIGRPAAEARVITAVADHAGNTWARRASVKGKDSLVAFSDLGGSVNGADLHVLLTVPTAVAFAPANLALSRNLMLLSIVTLVSLSLAWVAGNLLVLHPIQALLRATRGIAAGNLRARSRIEAGPREIVSLGYAFDDMAGKLEERKRISDAQNARIARLNRIYQILSAINGAIIRIRDRDELLQEACRIAVNLGRFRFAWVGLLDPDDDRVRPVAHAGVADDFVAGIQVTTNARVPEGRGMVGSAIREAKRAFSNDVQYDSRLAAWHQELVRLGIHSEAAFPLRIGNRVVGALALYSRERGFFDDEELRLLGELAADTSLGLENIEKERQLNYLAYWDPLTNLPNRTLFADRLDQSVLRAKRNGSHVVVMLIDIQHFAKVNDTKGRVAGDRLLQQVSGRLGALVRDTDALGRLSTGAARLGAHEFGLVLDAVNDPAAIETVAQRIYDTLEEPIALDQEAVPVTVRIGVAVYPRDGQHGEELLHKAQFAAHALTPASHHQLNFYSPEQDTAARERYALERALQQAVVNQEFHLLYQPRVDAREGRLLGAEALLRWQRPGHGVIPPDQFIPLLEETGLIVPVGEWVARTAFAQRVAWQKLVPDDFILSINASSVEFQKPDFASRLQSIAKEVGARTEWLEIEITETGLVESGTATLETLASLKRVGFLLSVDDFGTGYSSLSYLRRFPVNTLKIDRSFVRDIETDEEALSLVQSIIGLAASLKLHVIAEGVETEQQVRLLLERGCREIQGYYFSKPLSAQGLETLAAKKIVFPDSPETK